jgi:hypothetical protein
MDAVNKDFFYDIPGEKFLNETQRFQNKNIATVGPSPDTQSDPVYGAKAVSARRAWCHEKTIHQAVGL